MYSLNSATATVARVKRAGQLVARATAGGITKQLDATAATAAIEIEEAHSACVGRPSEARQWECNEASDTISDQRITITMKSTVAADIVAESELAC